MHDFYKFSMIPSTFCTSFVSTYIDTLRVYSAWKDILRDIESDYTMIPQNGNPNQYGIASRNAYHRNRKKKRK